MCVCKCVCACVSLDHLPHPTPYFTTLTLTP